MSFGENPNEGVPTALLKKFPYDTFNPLSAEQAKTWSFSNCSEYFDNSPIDIWLEEWIRLPVILSKTLIFDWVFCSGLS